ARHAAQPHHPGAALRRAGDHLADPAPPAGPRLLRLHRRRHLGRRGWLAGAGDQYPQRARGDARPGGGQGAARLGLCDARRHRRAAGLARHAGRVPRPADRRRRPGALGARPAAAHPPAAGLEAEHLPANRPRRAGPAARRLRPRRGRVADRADLGSRADDPRLRHRLCGLRRPLDAASRAAAM
ncbi:MAG: CDP-diacylglycerol--glycerol-3-phosphate 3-phosphatidyltransferase, partial [uncultured Craurococcus sp.]